MSYEEQSATNNNKNHLPCSTPKRTKPARQGELVAKDEADHVREQVKHDSEGNKSDSERPCDRRYDTTGRPEVSCRSASPSSSSSSLSKVESIRTVRSVNIGMDAALKVDQAAAEQQDGQRQDIEQQDPSDDGPSDHREQRLSNCQILSASNLLLLDPSGLACAAEDNDNNNSGSEFELDQVAENGTRLEEQFEGNHFEQQQHNHRPPLSCHCQQESNRSTNDSRPVETAMSVSSSFRYCNHNGSNNIINELDIDSNYSDNEQQAAHEQTMSNANRHQTGAHLTSSSQSARGARQAYAVRGLVGVGFEDVQPRLTFASQRMKEYFESFKSSRERRREYERAHPYQFFKATRTELVACLLFSLIVCYSLICCRVSTHAGLQAVEPPREDSPQDQLQASHLTFSSSSSISPFESSRPDQQAQDQYRRQQQQQQQPTQAPSSSLQVHLITGLVASVTVATLTQVLGHISGCHLIPSVSLALYFKGHISRARLISYLAAQSLGSLLGVALLGLLTSSQVTTLVPSSPGALHGLDAATLAGSHKQFGGSLARNHLGSSQALGGGPIGEMSGPIVEPASFKLRDSNKDKDNANGSRPRLVENIERRRRKRSSSIAPMELAAQSAGFVAPISSPTYEGFVTEGSETILLSIMEQKERQLSERLAHQSQPASRAGEMGPSSPTATLAQQQPKAGSDRVQAPPAAGRLALSSSSSSPSLPPNQMASFGTEQLQQPKRQQQKQQKGPLARVQVKTSNPGDDEIKLKLFGTNDTAEQASSLSVAQAGERLPLATSLAIAVSPMLPPSELEAGGTKLGAASDGAGKALWPNVANQTNSSSSFSDEVSLSPLLASSSPSPDRGPRRAHEASVATAKPTPRHPAPARLVMVPLHDEFTTTTISSHAGGGHDLSSRESHMGLMGEMPLPPVKEQAGETSRESPLAPKGGSLATTPTSSLELNKTTSPRPAKRTVVRKQRLQRRKSTPDANSTTNSGPDERSSFVKTMAEETIAERQQQTPPLHHSNGDDTRRVVNLLEFALPDEIMSSDSIEKCLVRMGETRHNHLNHQSPTSPCLSLSNGSQMFLFQMLATLLVNLTYLANVDPRRTDLGHKSLSIGLAYFLAHLLGLNSGGFMGQPAQLVGLMMFSSSAQFSWRAEWLVYFLTPLIGGLFSALSHEYIDFTSAKNRTKQLHLRRSFFSLDNLSGACSGNDTNCNTNNNNNTNTNTNIATSAQRRLAGNGTTPPSSIEDNDDRVDEVEDYSATTGDGNNRNNNNNICHQPPAMTTTGQRHKVASNCAPLARGARGRQRLASMGNYSTATTSSLCNDDGHGSSVMALHMTDLNNNNNNNNSINHSASSGAQLSQVLGSSSDGPQKQLEKSLSSSSMSYSRQMKLERERLKQMDTATDCANVKARPRTITTRDLNNNNNTISITSGGHHQSSILLDSNFLISCPAGAARDGQPTTKYHHHHHERSNGASGGARRGRSGDGGGLFEQEARCYAGSFNHQHEPPTHFQQLNERPNGVGQICTSRFM